MKNNYYIGRNWWLFAGIFQHNALHRHYAIQISIATNKCIIISDGKNNEQYYESCIIRNNEPHRLACNEPHITLLINPTSPAGHYLNQLFSNLHIASFSHPIAHDIKNRLNNFISGSISFETLAGIIKNLLEQADCLCMEENHFGDMRIKKAILYLESHYERVIPLAEAADQVHLSPTRFLHLFKQTTGITYRRFLLWNKLSKSFHYLKEHGVTLTAHEFGFTDGAHYSRTFKENFGFSPAFVLKS